MMQSHSKKIALIGLLTACGILFGYVENLIDLPIGIPGVKIGISNIITVICIYMIGPIEALFVLVLRVVMSGFLFGNMYSLLYSLSGALFSYAFMVLGFKLNFFSIIGNSMLGGVTHNLGQLIIACIIISNLKLTFYIPVLLISGLIAGAIIGIISSIMINRLKRSSIFIQ